MPPSPAIAIEPTTVISPSAPAVPLAIDGSLPRGANFERDLSADRTRPIGLETAGFVELFHAGPWPLRHRGQIHAIQLLDDVLELVCDQLVEGGAGTEMDDGIKMAIGRHH